VYIPNEGSTFSIVLASGAIFTWDVRPQHVLEVACKTAGRNLTRAEWSELVGGGWNLG
jgi:hypothetical protein